MMISLLLMILSFDVQTVRAEEACGKPICPDFVDGFKYKGFEAAIEFCAEEQCSSSDNIGCAVPKSKARDFAYLYKSKNFKRSPWPSDVPNCNKMLVDLRAGKKVDSIRLEFQHPCDKYKIGCIITFDSKNRFKKEKESHRGLDRIKAGKEAGMPQYTGNFSEFARYKSTNRNQKNQLQTGKRNNDNQKNNPSSNGGASGDAGGSLADELGKKDSAAQAEFNAASRVAVAAPTPNYAKKFQCENGASDPGPMRKKKVGNITVNEKLAIGKNYKYVFTGGASRQWLCVGDSNIADGSIALFCPGSGHSIDLFQEVSYEGMPACQGVRNGLNMVIKDTQRF